MQKLLIDRNEYLASGLHIGTKQVSERMKKFIFQVRRDGLSVFDIKKIDERVRIAAKFLAKREKILVVARKTIAHTAVEKFAELIGAKAVVGRYIPGTLTNPNFKEFYEADVLVVTDTFTDRQAILDAVKTRIPIVAICDGSSDVKNVDLIIPANNKGRKAIATLYWLLGREILKERGEIKTNSEYKVEVKDFIT
jgi:small subunit ribosomal protein S2